MKTAEKVAQECADEWTPDIVYDEYVKKMTAILRAYAESIREECAKVAENINPGPSDFVEVSIARAIRSLEIP